MPRRTKLVSPAEFGAFLIALSEIETRGRLFACFRIGVNHRPIARRRANARLLCNLCKLSRPSAERDRNVAIKGGWMRNRKSNRITGVVLLFFGSMSLLESWAIRASPHC